MSKASESSKPLLIYDGDCPFCLRCADYGRKLTGKEVVYRPYQEAAPDFPQIPLEQFREAVQFVDRDGRVTSGAEAVFRAIAYAPGWRWTLCLYIRIRFFAAVSEIAYRWVARNRSGLSRLLGWK